MQKHKWYDVIVAWASGEEIQAKHALFYTDGSYLDEWGDYENCELGPSFDDPHWEWRVKPKTEIKKYKMAYIKNSSYEGCTCVEVTNNSLDNPAEYDVDGFIRWVSDVVTLEIEV